MASVLHHDYQALFAPVVHGLDCGTVVLTNRERKGDRAPLCLDQVSFDFSPEVPCELRPSVLGDGHREKYLVRKQVATVANGIISVGMAIFPLVGVLAQVSCVWLATAGVIKGATMLAGAYLVAKGTEAAVGVSVSRQAGTWEGAMHVSSQ